MNAPQLPEAFSSLSSLGGVVEFFPLRKGKRWASLILALILLIGSTGVLVYGIYVAYLGWGRYGAAVVGEALFWPLVVTAGLFLLSLLFAWIAYANWAKAIALYQNGFAYKDRCGLRIWRWKDVAALRMAVTRHDVFGIYTGTTHVYSVENRNGNQLVLNDGFNRVEELARAIEEKTFPSLFEQASQQYNAGRNLTFGPVMVNQAAIQIGKKSYAWDEVQQVTVQRGYLHIARKEGGLFSGAKTALAGILNLRVLLSLISQVVRVKVG
jgi:energy-coupling factor transporter transmembrane protein EcfT